ncbi:hypothetical protein LCGC14_1367830 [marine sediment metagenome]|uniref:Uncharacterized protein n=1 Tax=marine sediment metagenome TaxID=412755 RepID=A0A0F9N876_9ZZZZ
MKNEKKATPCPQEFKDFLKTCSLIDLVSLFSDLKQSPEDIHYMKAVNDEMKSR